ncbi:helix-turn-helix transcriptional regulator [Phenylobacterium soli]|uniref:HTH luxR-type domain-containing protein n=1 Tax=Phenylobacterium soli TaxID=2170551 RepID=A0A328ANG6_9CAUL|nr:LuxR family transcriptional regulator [Phenylobacterium soli]RAK56117.1 hypothetical protein DJ017_17160 [Phenylobacterium soli]
MEPLSRAAAPNGPGQLGPSSMGMERRLAPGDAFGERLDELDMPPGETGWDRFHPGPRFEIDTEGQVRAANAAGQLLIANRSIGLSGGRLRFGAASSNRRLERAIALSRQHPRQKLILRRMDGAWRSAELHSSPHLPTLLLLFATDEDLQPQAFAALADAFELTRGEARVLQALCTGSCPKEIAQQLDVSEHTVRSHLRAIYAKLNVRGLANAIRLATQLVS